MEISSWHNDMVRIHYHRLDMAVAVATGELSFQSVDEKEVSDGDTHSRNLKSHTGMVRGVSSYANGKRLSTGYKVLQADCQNRKTRVLSMNGKTVNGEWHDVHLGSLGETEYNWLCGK